MDAAKPSFPHRPAAPGGGPAAKPVLSGRPAPSPTPKPAPSPAPQAEPQAVDTAKTIAAPKAIDTAKTAVAATVADPPKTPVVPTAADAPTVVDAATVIDPRRSADEGKAHTLPATSGSSVSFPVAAAGKAAPAGSTTVGARTTVLPRVQVVGDRPELVQDERRRFEIVKRLGEGGAGEVVAALDNDIGRKVALKKIRGEVLSPEALARFVEEIRTIGRLEHPNIIPIHDVGIDEQGDYYFVMKLVDGETIEAIIDKLRAGDSEYHRLYPFERRVQIFHGLLEAVAFAHAQGTVHRDIKPANVMVGRFGEVLLMDWGIAKCIREGGHSIDDAVCEQPAPVAVDSSHMVQTQLGALIGTPLYMSPEQARGEPVDERSDVYSLAVLFWEFLFLRHYLEGCKTIDEVLEGVQKHEVAISKAKDWLGQPTVPMDLRWFLKKGLAKDPEDRYASAQAMIERLDRRSEGLIPIQCHITFAKRVTTTLVRSIDRHPLAYTLGMAGTVVGAVALGILSLV
jgi:serine/threonine protein kinase